VPDNLGMICLQMNLDDDHFGCFVVLHKEMKLLSGPVTTIFCYFSVSGCNEHAHQYVLLLSGFPRYVASSRNLSEFLLEFFSHFCHLNVLF
jgi:hypothetical protein